MHVTGAQMPNIAQTSALIVNTANEYTSILINLIALLSICVPIINSFSVFQTNLLLSS